MTRMTPCRLMTLQRSQRRLTDAETFMVRSCHAHTRPPCGGERFFCFMAIATSVAAHTQADARIMRASEG
jgi:hypothetical protein